MKRIGRALGLGAGLLALGGAFAGCGGDDDNGSRGGGSFASITSAIESPTGTVDETTAADIGVEFEKVSQAQVPGGMRRDAQTAQSSGTVDCPAGGSVTASGSGDQSSGHSTASYNDCCVSANCCIDGDADIYFSTAQGAAYTYCGSYDVSYSCEGTTTSISYQGCLNSTGELVYAIEVDGDTYAVSGSYSNGSGTLEITGANGTWTCTYTSSSGTCTGTGGSFTF